MSRMQTKEQIDTTWEAFNEIKRLVSTDKNIDEKTSFLDEARAIVAESPNELVLWPFSRFHRRLRHCHR